MTWNPGLTKLRDLLAYLYPTIALSKQGIEQAGMPAGQIEFTSAATSNWHNILKEAQRRKKVQAIVAVAREEFSERAEELANLGADRISVGALTHSDVSCDFSMDLAG